MDFSEIIAACDLKVDRCRQLIELKEICDHLRSRSSLDHDSKSFTYENEKLLFSEITIFN